MSSGTKQSCTCVLIPDTSALLLAAEGIDPLYESIGILKDYCNNVEVHILVPVIRELERLASGRGARAIAARLARAGLDRYFTFALKVDVGGCSSVDDCIMSYVRGIRERDAVVLTTDRELAKALRSAGVKYMTWWRSRRKFILNFPTSSGAGSTSGAS